MKQKILIVLLALACVFCLVFGSTACFEKDDGNQNGTEQGGTNTPTPDADGEEGNGEPEGDGHTHEWQETYTYDDIHHYKKCDSCAEVSEKAEHEFNQSNLCQICGYENIPETEGLKFTLNEDGLSYSVTGIGSVTATKIRIPAEHNGKPVTSIGEAAFEACESLISIKIPDSVTYIGVAAFFFCRSLESITIPDSVVSIDYDAFMVCTSLESLTVSSGNRVYHSAENCIIETATKTLIAGCKNSIIPADGSVTSIGISAFYGCMSLESITIPNGITSIGERAFGYCSSLESITIPDGVTSIGDNAFYCCSSLESINYKGTTEQWGAINKDSRWDSYTTNYIINCTDGEIAKDGTVTKY